MAPQRTPSARSEHVLDLDDSPAMQWELVGVTDHGERVPAVVIGEEPLTIGRHSRSGLVISSPKVSKAHAEVLAIGPTVFVRDLDSTNGTFVNGQKISTLTPVGEGDQIRIGELVFHVKCDDGSESETDEHAYATEVSLDHWMDDSLDDLVRDGGLNIVFQPIVQTRSGAIQGFEALVRSTVVGLESPLDLFRLASRLKLVGKLSHTCRMMAANEAKQLPRNAAVFLNTNGEERIDANLLYSVREVRNAFPHIQFVIEIHEDCIIEPSHLEWFHKELKKLDMGLAFDDFGAGKSRLLDLLHVRPDFVKFDRSLVNHLHLGRGHERAWVQSLVESIQQLGIRTIAEGVESDASLIACRTMNFDLCQGFATGAPGPACQWFRTRSRVRDTMEDVEAWTE